MELIYLRNKTIVSKRKFKDYREIIAYYGKEYVTSQSLYDNKETLILLLQEKGFEKTPEMEKKIEEFLSSEEEWIPVFDLAGKN